MRAGWLTTLVTCRAAGDRESGVYECRDVDGLASDSITVNVAHRNDNTRGKPPTMPCHAMPWSSYLHCV